MIASYMHKNNSLTNSQMNSGMKLYSNLNSLKTHKVVFYISHPCLIIEQ